MPAQAIWMPSTELRQRAQGAPDRRQSYEERAGAVRSDRGRFRPRPRARLRQHQESGSVLRHQRERKQLARGVLVKTKSRDKRFRGVGVTAGSVELFPRFQPAKLSKATPVAAAAGG